MKKFLKILLIIVLVIIVAVGGLFGFLTVTEFKPADVEAADTVGDSTAELLPISASDGDFAILSWNIGYAGLGAASDFFMDGGTHSMAADKAAVNGYLEGIKTVCAGDYDFIMLQEVDRKSTRTYKVDEAEALARGNSVFALNFSCPFVPNPNTLIIEPIGKVNSGLLTCSSRSIAKAERISLPCPFSWPLRVANLKRCLLVSYIPIEGSDKQLVLVNLHLEAYDSGEGKIAQTRQLREFIKAEYDKGNYVIAGGDFNQVFPGSLELYPNGHPDLWLPGELDESLLPEGEGWKYAYDSTTPTCRLLNQPYDPSDTENTQHYVIDGFILSPNVELKNAETMDLGFANSDHNPVLINVSLK